MEYSHNVDNVNFWIRIYRQARTDRRVLPMAGKMNEIHVENDNTMCHTHPNNCPINFPLTKNQTNKQQNQSQTMEENNNVQPLVAIGGEKKPWVERYRPKSLQDVSHQSEVVATLENAVQTGRLPHMLFYGPPGSGKVR